MSECKRCLELEAALREIRDSEDCYADDCICAGCAIIRRVVGLPPTHVDDGQGRDATQNPAEGDVLHPWNASHREILIDKVTSEEVAYRITDGQGGLLGSYRVTLRQWREQAPRSVDSPCPDHPGESDDE